MTSSSADLLPFRVDLALGSLDTIDHSLFAVRLMDYCHLATDYV